MGPMVLCGMPEPNHNDFSKWVADQYENRLIQAFTLPSKTIIPNRDIYTRLRMNDCKCGSVLVFSIDYCETLCTEK